MGRTVTAFSESRGIFLCLLGLTFKRDDSAFQILEPRVTPREKISHPSVDGHEEDNGGPRQSDGERP